MNPLRIDDKPGRDTRKFVREVLTFVSSTFASMENNSVEFRNGSLTGAALIIDTCIEALEESTQEEDE